ncbi:transposase [Saccharothrix carnea]|uniref:transposase n=1 Tax=Saccharothrix carnea TaxID=1280637 RepID=UPI003CCC268A
MAAAADDRPWTYSGWSPLSAVGAAAILAETCDPRRFTTTRALVEHAGLAPREKSSGMFTGRAELTGQARPGLRLAAWRTVWGAHRANPVHAARYRHLNTRTALGSPDPGPGRHRRRPAAPARRHHHRQAMEP